MPPKTREVTVGRRRRTVVQTKPAWWVETDGSGSLVHAGRLLDKQEPIQVLATPKPCTRCKRPAMTATARGRAHHPQCEGWLEVLPDDLALQIVLGVAEDLRVNLTSNHR